MFSTRYIADNYNFQTVIFDSVAFVSWAARNGWRSFWLSAQLALLALAYAAMEVVTGGWVVFSIAAAVVTVVAQAVFHVAIVVAFIVAIILTGGWACRWVK